MLQAIYPVIGKQSCFPFYLSGIGITGPEYHIIRDEGLISHQILFTLEGEGEIKIDGDVYRTRPGGVFYVASGIPHEYYPVGDKWTTCWMVFRGEYLKDIMQKWGFPPYIYKQIASTNDMEQIFDMIYKSASENGIDDERCSLFIYNYIMLVRKLLLTNGDSYGCNVADKAISFLNANFNRDISLEELAYICQVSKQHVCRVFKDKTGMRPLQYLARKRINESKVLLYSTDDSIADIGVKVGYSDPTYFGMVFKKYEGVSPSEFRKMNRFVLV